MVAGASIGYSAGQQQFNMNCAWLELIYNIMQSFIMARFQEDFDTMYTALDNLEMIISPKITNNELELKIQWIKRNKDRIYKRNAEGVITRENPLLKEQVKDACRECFSKLLIKLDEAGILTRLAEDPNMDMSKMHA